MKKFLPWLVSLLVIFAIYLYASPYIALNNIKKAAEQGDADKLSGYIDFPSVKQSIKDQFKAAMVEDLATSDEQDGFEALGTMLAAAMIDPLIDGMITPDGVALMLQGQKLDFDLSNGNSEDTVKTKNENIDYKAGYLSFNRFKVQIIDADDSDESLDVIMHRDGLSWKVTRISFSLDSGNKSDINLEDSIVSNLATDEEDYAIDVTENDEFEDVFHGMADSEEVADIENSDFTNDTFNDEGYYTNETGANAVEITGQVPSDETDWTPYLKPMMTGCNYPNPTENLPKLYKGSIANKKVKVDQANAIDGYGETITTYTLKNATAFGQPLLKIEYLQGYEWGSLELYFKDTKFTALRPQFKLPKVNEADSEGYTVIENNSEGYTVDDGMWETILKFDKKRKSIICA